MNEQDISVSFRIATPSAPGAIALIELIGDVEPALRRLTNVADWPPGRPRLVDLVGIDEGIVVRVTDQFALLMPHGGPRVVQRLREALSTLGAAHRAPGLPGESVDRKQTSDARAISPGKPGITCVPAFPPGKPGAMCLHPEAGSLDEALMLEALATASSPPAVDLLLDQPRRWAEWRATDENVREPIDSIRQRSRILDRLQRPPLVVLVGAPNIGKSTLTNALAGREAAIAADLAGTTRDYVSAMLELAGLTVLWFDTPGRREASDPIEHEAIRISNELIGRADLLIAGAAPDVDWPRLPREADMRVLLKADLDGGRGSGVGGRGGESEVDLLVSALTGEGLAELTRRVREALVPREAMEHGGPWMFDPRIEV